MTGLKQDGRGIRSNRAGLGAGGPTGGDLRREAGQTRGRGGDARGCWRRVHQHRTIPSKTMREAVLHLSGYNYKSIYGMNYRVKEKITMADLAFRVQHVIKTEIDVTEAQLSRNNVEILVGIASFVDATHVKVTNSRGANIYEGKNVLIATGTKPANSPKVQINGTTIVNSDLIMNLKELPKTMIIVGGGVIGVEYCCMFAALGVRVTLIERRPRLLEFADTEIVEALSYHLRDARVTMRLNEEVESVEELPD